MSRPFRAFGLVTTNPGRCPGLGCASLSGFRMDRVYKQAVVRTNHAPDLSHDTVSGAETSNIEHRTSNIEVGERVRCVFRTSMFDVRCSMFKAGDIISFAGLGVFVNCPSASLKGWDNTAQGNAPRPFSLGSWHMFWMHVLGRPRSGVIASGDAGQPARGARRDGWRKRGGSRRKVLRACHALCAVTAVEGQRPADKPAQGNALGNDGEWRQP